MYTEASALDWHRPDNTANLFAAVSCEDDPHVFRLSIELEDEVHPKLLQKALEDTLPYFRAFDVSYIRGFFGGRFKAQVQSPPQVEADIGYICRYFRWGEGYLFRVLYGGRKFHLEASHALTDGTGGLYFLKATAYRYIQLVYGQDLPEQYRKACFGLKKGMDILDGYAKNYRRTKCSEHRPSPAYQLSGEKRTVGDMGLLSVEMSVRELKAVSKRHHATISEYLSAVILKTLADSCPNFVDKTIRIELPVNLRTLFQTETALNFFSNIGIELLPEQHSLSFQEIINVVKTQFQEKIRKEKFEQRFGISVWGERCLVGRIAPLKVREWFCGLCIKCAGGQIRWDFQILEG